MGLPLELAEVEIDSLVPPELQAGSVADFLGALPRHDDAMAKLLEDARAEGKVLRYVGQVDREGRASARLRTFPAPVPLAMESPMNSSPAGPEDLEGMLRRVLREELGLSPTSLAARWLGGELVLRPGRAGIQEKSWPIDTFFHKVVMVRNRLRVLEQQINGAEIPEPLKVQLQGYITGCYGTLTSFNVLFEEEADRFRGSGKGGE